MTKKIKPMEEVPNKGTNCFVVGVFLRSGKIIGVNEFNFDGEDTAYRAVDRGIAFKKKKHAQRAAIFILNLMRESEPLPGCITSQPDDGTSVWGIAFLNVPNCSKMDFSQSNELHQQVFKNHMLFSSEKDARAASKFILEALKCEVLRQKLKYLTEAPVDGTKVYAVSIYGVGGSVTLQFKSNNSRHMQLLELGLLFTSEEDAKRALEYLKEPLKPTRPKAMPDKPDAQPDVPAERDDGSDE